MKSTDYEQVRILAANILKDDKQMILLADDLNKELEALKGSFMDDAIVEIEEYVKKLLMRLQLSQTAFMTIARELQEYAEILKQGKA